jgi:hypothetical protein
MRKNQNEWTVWDWLEYAGYKYDPLWDMWVTSRQGDGIKEDAAFLYGDKVIAFLKAKDPRLTGEISWKNSQFWRFVYEPSHPQRGYEITRPLFPLKEAGTNPDPFHPEQDQNPFDLLLRREEKEKSPE